MDLKSYRRAPATKEHAERYISELLAGNKNKSARIAVLKLALGPHGNLTNEARAVYQHQLDTELAA